MQRISLLLLLSLGLFSQSLPDSDLTCLKCHQSGGWFPLSEEPEFTHSLDTDFPLVHSHADLNCKQCHAGDSIDAFHQFTVKGMDCVDCHQDIHQNYWGNQCERCHSPEGWDPAQAYRRHDQTLFPLVAAHHSLSCYLCHTAPGNTPSLDCQDCHETDFEPGLTAHQGLSPRPDCSTCHAPTRWDQILAVNHDGFFPIRSGEHRGEWDTCTDCHNTPGEYQSFTCFGSGCHDVGDMNSEHCEDGDCERCDNFTYPRTGVTPDDCYFCHPQGNESKCGD